VPSEGRDSQLPLPLAEFFYPPVHEVYMSLRINHNIAAINGHRMMLKNDAAVSGSLERLSSGLRINKAADDAAGLVISEQMRAQIAGIGQAINNSETAVAMVQTSEGALDEINTLLNKARELTLHAANTGVNDVSQLSADQAELDNVIESISRISALTQFGTKSILDGSLSGADTFAGGINRVKVGNLANNPGITAGTVSMVVSAGSKEATTLRGSAATDSYVFSGTVTGVTLGGKRVNGGVSVTLAIDGKVLSYVTTGAEDATTLASHLNTLSNPMGFGVTANASGQMVVTRSVVGATDFASSITFTRGATVLSAGVKEKVSSALKVTAPTTNSGAAAVLFGGVGKLSGVQTTSVVNGGTTFDYTLQTATGGVFTGSVTVATGTTSTMSAVLSGLQTSIRAHSTFSGSSVTLDGGAASGTFRVGVARGFNTITTDFSFSLTVDHLNVTALKSQANTVTFAASTFTTGVVANATFTTGAAGATAIQGNALVGTSYLRSGNALNLTISGVSLVFTGARTMTTLASTMQTAINALGGNMANIRVAFRTGGTSFSGLAGQQNITGNLAGGFRGFVFYNNDGNSMSVSLTVDQKEGSDVSKADVVAKVGVMAGATLNLTTVAQTVTQGSASVSAHSGVSLSSISGNALVASGADVTAVMTTANGVILNLTTSHVTASGSATLTLTSGSQTLGYRDFSTEISSALGTSGGIASFSLNGGAVFQVGPNANQHVGVVIESVASTELGRNVVGAGSLLSLYDLHSSQKGALLNGLSKEALMLIDATTDEITTLRGRLGAIQSNTLESGLNSLRATSENMISAESTIRDVDFAAESATFTRNQILVQASTSMLAQANQLPQNVLKLLQ
jgi:flagellin